MIVKVSALPGGPSSTLRLLMTSASAEGSVGRLARSGPHSNPLPMSVSSTLRGAGRTLGEPSAGQAARSAGERKLGGSEALAQAPRSIRSNPDVPGNRYERAEAVGRTRRSWRTRRQSATVAIGREVDAHRARKDVLADTERRRARLITSDDGLVPEGCSDSGSRPVRSARNEERRNEGSGGSHRDDREDLDLATPTRPVG